MPRTQEEIDRERNEDLKRIVEAEALLLLLLRRARKLAASKTKDPLKQADIAYQAARAAALLSWKNVARSNIEATLDQIEKALGEPANFTASDTDIFNSIEQSAEVSASQAGHVVSNSILASATEGQEVNIPAKDAIIAATVVVTAFSTSREAVVEKLPKRQREELWMRRDTAGDRKVCPECDRLEGDVAPVSVGIQPKAPVHGRCRCSDTIVSREEAMDSLDRKPPPDARVEKKSTDIAKSRKRAAPQTAKERRAAQRADKIEKLKAEKAALKDAERKAKAEARAAETIARREEARRIAAEQKAKKALQLEIDRAAQIEKEAKLAAEKKAAAEAKATAKREAKAKEDLLKKERAARAKAEAEAKAAKVEAEKAAKLAEKERLAAAKKAATQDPRVAEARSKLAEEREAIEAKIARMEKRVAEGKPDRYGIIDAAKSDLAQLAEREKALSKAVKIRESGMSTTSLENAISGQVLTQEERRAIGEFAGNTYTSVRRQQMGLLRGPPEYVDEVAKQGLALESAIANNVNYRGELWRGIVVDESTAERLLSSTSIDWMGATTSTSRSRDVALKFSETTPDSGAVGIVFRVKEGRGLPIENLGMASEQEILQSGQSAFRVISKRQDGDRWIVDLEQQ